MSKWSSRVALTVLLAGALFAQMPSKNQKVDNLRVGARLACQCGCADTVATCSMLGCSFSHPAKEKISQMQAAGASDATIIDDFIKQYGQQIYRGAPNSFGWLIPYAILLLGALVVIQFVRRSKQSKPVLVTDAKLARYNDEIEKELNNLDR